MKGPASHVSENGQYTDGLVSAAATVSDKLDTHLCPDNIKVLTTLTKGGAMQVFSDGRSVFQSTFKVRESMNNFNRSTGCGSL